MQLKICLLTTRRLLFCTLFVQVCVCAMCCRGRVYGCVCSSRFLEHLLTIRPGGCIECRHKDTVCWWRDVCNCKVAGYSGFSLRSSYSLYLFKCMVGLCACVCSCGWPMDGLFLLRPAIDALLIKNSVLLLFSLQDTRRPRRWFPTAISSRSTTMTLAAFSYTMCILLTYP